MAFDPATLPAPPKENDQLAAARLSPQTLELLALRRSLKLFFFDPDVGPNPEELNALLRIAARVPDHGKLGPWRFVVIEGEARARVSDELAEIIAGDQGVNEERLAIERKRFLHTPLCVMVVSSPKESVKVPEWEQILSSGAACYNLLLAAHAMGYAGVWLTEWPAFDERARPALGLKAGERVAGFVYLGAPKQAAMERQRADVETRVSRL